MKKGMIFLYKNKNIDELIPNIIARFGLSHICICVWMWYIIKSSVVANKDTIEIFPSLKERM